MVDAPIPLAPPDLGPLEEAEVLEVLRSGRLALGPKAAEFERRLATFTGQDWGVALSSGTAGLHLSYRALGVGPDDCVVTASFTFISAANAARYQGAEPVFLDIDAESLCLSVEAVKTYLESCKETDGELRDPVTDRRVAAIVPTDVFGMPADVEGLVALAKPFGIPVVSDSCEALGSRRQRKAGGSWAHAGDGADAIVFGFYPNKQITTGEGGAVVGHDPDLEERLISMRNQGRRAGDAWLRHTRLGFNYRLDELSAALGVAQMRRIEEILARRAEIARRYDDALAPIAEVAALPAAPEGTDPALFVYFLRTAPGVDRDRLVQRINALGVESKSYFDIPVHEQPPYAGRADLVPAPLEVTEAVASSIVIVPFSAALTDEQIDRAAQAVRTAIEEVAS